MLKLAVMVTTVELIPASVLMEVHMRGSLAGVVEEAEVWILIYLL
jgi:hypothetical protein